MWDLLPGICGPSRQMVSHGYGLSRQVSLYCFLSKTTSEVKTFDIDYALSYFKV